MNKRLFRALIIVACHCTLSTSSKLPDTTGGCVNNYFQVTEQTLYLNNDSRLACKQSPEIPSDYIVYPRLGAYKIHYTAQTWNDARNTCINEGAHLPVITSAKEEEILRKMQQEKNGEYLWIGVHEQFKKDDWVTVHDQPLGKVGYVHWSEGEPNNYNNENEHCVCNTVNGMNDIRCDRLLWFFCKIDLKQWN